MRVDMWADMVCIWCGLANERVNRALAEFEHGDDVELVHHSFRLMPTHPDEQSWEFEDFMVNQRGYAPEQAKASADRVEGMARADGIEEYHVHGISVGNSTLAHEFLAWATTQGKHREAWDLVMTRHYADRAPIWTVDDLLVFARELELDEDGAREALTDRRFRQQIEDDHNALGEMGAGGVPFFVIDGKYGISGAQSTEALVEAFRTVHAQSNAASAAV